MKKKKKNKIPLREGLGGDWVRIMGGGFLRARRETWKGGVGKNNLGAKGGYGEGGWKTFYQSKITSQPC